MFVCFVFSDKHQYPVGKVTGKHGPGAVDRPGGLAKVVQNKEWAASHQRSIQRGHAVHGAGTHCQVRDDFKTMLPHEISSCKPQSGA